MKKKSIAWIVSLLVLPLVICLTLFVSQNKSKNKSYEGKLFESSTWPLTWEELYEVCEFAMEFGVTSEMEEVHILYRNKKDFNADVENLLQYMVDSCGKPYYGTRGESPKAYISKAQNTGTYEEELSWISVPDSCLGVRLVRIGSGEEAYMKVIITDEPLRFLDGEVVKSDNIELAVRIGGEQVNLSWHYVTGRRYLSETTPLYQPGDKVWIGIPKEHKVQYHDGNQYGTLGVKYLEKNNAIYYGGTSFLIRRLT